MRRIAGWPARRVRLGASGQMTVEAAMSIPLLLISAYVVVNLMLFVEACCEFDRIALDAEHTTARQGDHYDALRELYTLPANASSAGVPVHVHRLNLDDETVYAVRLQLAETGDFRLGVAENRAVKVCFTNRLDCPGWWNELSKWLGEYNVRKYQKFIELYGRPITDKDIAENRYGILRVFRQVKAYFDENPEYGVLFPDVAWPV